MSNESAHLSRIVPSYIETGLVIDVDIEMYTISVVTQYTQKPLTGIAFSTPYQHHSNGEGIYFMPEVGSLVWLCWPSDGSRPFVLGWSPAREDNGSLRANKLNLNPGDIYLGTRDENFLILRRGGILQIGGGPLSQRMYLPLNNTIKDFCENYSLSSIAGDLEWTVDREETTTDGNRPGRLIIKAREYASDRAPIAVLQIGSHKSAVQNILSLVIKESGAEAAATVISLELRKDGSVFWKSQQNVDLLSGGDFTVYAKKTLALLGGVVAINGNQVAVDAPGGVTAKTPVFNVSGDVQVGGNVKVGSGASGTFTSYSGQKITVQDGIIVSIE